MRAELQSIRIMCVIQEWGQQQACYKLSSIYLWDKYNPMKPRQYGKTYNVCVHKGLANMNTFD